MSRTIRHLTLPLARSAAIVALMSAPLIAAPLGVVHAQTTKPVPAAVNPDQKNIEQHIQQLHAQLKITSDQESKWNSVAQAMRDNAANMQKLIDDKRQQAPQNMTAVEDLKTNEELTQTHLDGLKNFTSAFETLYNSMSDQQKKNADQVFAKFNRTPQPASANHNG
jgi:glutamine synthetase adenylyltransferase